MAESKKDTRSSVTTVKLQLKEYKAIDTYETKSKLSFGQYLAFSMAILDAEFESVGIFDL